MKRKSIFLVIAILAVLVVVSCSGKKEASGSTAVSGGSSEIQSAQASGGSQSAPVSGSAAAWPDNQFTRLIERPNAGTFLAFTGSGNDARIDMDWTEDDIKAYVNQMKTAGFVRDEYEDQNDFTMVSMSKDNARITLMPQGILMRLR